MYLVRSWYVHLYCCMIILLCVDFVLYRMIQPNDIALWYTFTESYGACAIARLKIVFGRVDQIDRGGGHPPPIKLVEIPNWFGPNSCATIKNSFFSQVSQLGIWYWTKLVRNTILFIGSTPLRNLFINYLTLGTFKFSLINYPILSKFFIKIFYCRNDLILLHVYHFFSV